MNLYTSYGTYGFLNQIKLNNPDHDLFQFSASDTLFFFALLFFIVGWLTIRSTIKKLKYQETLLRD